MRFEVYYRDSLRDSYDENPPKVKGVHFTHVATVETESVDTLFRVMNVVDGSDCEIPQKIRNRSMSVGDVAVDATGQGRVCCSFGWADVDGALLTRMRNPGAPSFTVTENPDAEEEPIACWSPGCYLAVDTRTGECEHHGMPPHGEVD